MYIVNFCSETFSDSFSVCKTKEINMLCHVFFFPRKEKEKTKKSGNCESKNEASRESPFQLVDKTKCGYLRAHEISVERYKDPVKMFQDKKSTIKT